MKIVNLSFIILFILSFNLVADEISGVPRVTDGDTIRIFNKRIRFHGIDAPEKKQICLRNSKEYRCGHESTNALIKKINGNLVVCKVQDKLDKFRRYIGICFLKNIDLNKWMVRNGYAVAYRRYSKNYIEDENYAKKNKIGLWSGTFILPEKWRKLN